MYKYKAGVVLENVTKEQKGNLKILLPTIAAIVGIGLLLIGNFVGKDDETEDEIPRANDPSYMDANEFAISVEEKIINICKEVDGAGHVRAAVTLGGGYRAIYAANSQSSSNSYRNETVLTGNGSNKKAILIGYENPEIVGIGIVCSGGNEPSVRQNIISLVSAAFNVSTNRIYVAGS